MEDLVKQKVEENLGMIQTAEPIREKEEDLLKRQIIICQDAMKEDVAKFVGCVDLFEAMLMEDIKKKKVGYDPLDFENIIRKKYNLSPQEKITKHMEYLISLEKFRNLYYLFKEHHMPVGTEVKI